MRYGVTPYLAEGTHMNFYAAIPVWAVTIIFIVQNAVVGAGSFQWRRPRLCIKFLCPGW